MTLLLALFACAEPGLDPLTVPPAEGAWRVTVEPERDTCAADAVDPAAPLLPGVQRVWLTVAEGGFSVALDGGDPARCEQEGAWFACRPAVERARVGDDLLVSNAVILEGAAEGDALVGDVIVDYKCTGSGCADFEAAWGARAPCRVAGAFTAVPE